MENFSARGTFHQTVESEGKGSALKSFDMEATDLLGLLQESMSKDSTNLRIAMKKV